VQKVYVCEIPAPAGRPSPVRQIGCRAWQMGLWQRSNEGVAGSVVTELAFPLRRGQRRFLLKAQLARLMLPNHQAVTDAQSGSQIWPCCLSGLTRWGGTDAIGLLLTLIMNVDMPFSSHLSHLLKNLFVVKSRLIFVASIDCILKLLRQLKKPPPSCCF
jgi:hypothetical protein